MARPVTLRMIAAHLGVSVQTVSNVLQNTGRVAPATAERVSLAAAEMGYIPNLGAQALRGKSTKTLAFVVCDPALTSTPSEYLGYLIPVVASAIRAIGYRPAIHFADEGDIDRVLLPARQGLVDGVLLLANQLAASKIEALAKLKTPIVLFEREAPGEVMPSVVVDAAGGIAAAVEHVHQQGARRIVYLDGGPHWPMTTSASRYLGYKRARAELGIEELPDLLGNWQFESGHAAFGELLSRGPLPEAVICANDQMAVGFLKAAQQHGVRVPDDLLVTGFDDLEFSRYTTPQLTSVRLPLAEMSQGAATLLAAVAVDPIASPHTSKVYSAELVVRGSSLRTIKQGYESGGNFANTK